MEWFADDPNRGETALAILALAVIACIIWFGRRRLAVAIPVALLFLLLAAIAIPGAIPARSAAQRSTCINNLKMIDNAKAEWAKRQNRTAGDIPTEADLYGIDGTNGVLRHRLSCPRGGTYTIGALGQSPTCSFSEKGHKLE